MLEILEDKERKHVEPLYLHKEVIQAQKVIRMCRYYAYHIECPDEEEEGKCSYLHNENIRITHDHIVKERRKNKTVHLDTIRQKLVNSFDKSNTKMVDEALWKEEALHKYPIKPN